MKITKRKIVLKSGEEITLISPDPNDAKEVLEHFRRIFKEHYRNFNRSAEYFEKITVEEEAGVIDKSENSTNTFMIAAFNKRGQVIGLLGFNGNNAPFQKHSGHIGMGVETEYHNSGLGTELLKTCADEAKKLGFHSIQLEVRTFNKAAIALYEKNGFRRVGELKEVAFIDEQFFDEYIYQKLLS